jgi:ornithine lipid hydroxylase
MMNPPTLHPTLRALLARTFLPIMLVASLCAYAFAPLAGLPAESAVMAIGIVTLLLALLLERLMPFRAAWNQARGDTATDWLSFAVLAAAAEPLVKAAMALAVVAMYGHSTGLGVWFASALPLTVQVIIATVLIELGKYAAHRWHHASPALWWLHALHHGSQRLVAVNNFRYHPLNYAINQALSLLPLMLLGAPADVLLGYLAISQPIVMVQHANIDLRSGWLNAVLSTPEAHRWHHSKLRAEGDSNFGNALLLWDHVFGTYRSVQHTTHAPTQIGLYAASHYPARAGYVQQLLSMFSPGCCKAGAA